MSKATRRFIINKLGELVISLLIVTILSFLLVRLSPIDPAEAYARRSMAAFSFTDEQMEALREKMGLNDSLPVQYVKWIRDAFHLDFGKSFVSGQSVFEKVTTAIGITVTIVIIWLFDYRQRVVSGFTSYPRNNSVSCVFAGNVQYPFGYITADFATGCFCERGGQTMSRTKHILSYSIPIVILLFFLFGSFFAPHDPTATNIRGKYLSSSAEYPFGTDNFGRCEFSRILEGGKITLGIVLVGSAIVILLGSGAHRRNAALYPFILLSDTVGKCSALQRSYTSCNVILDDSKSNGDLLYSASASSALFLVS